MLKWTDFSLISENIRLIFFDFSLKLGGGGLLMAETVFYTQRVYIHTCAYVRAHIVAISQKEATLPTLVTPKPSLSI